MRNHGRGTQIRLPPPPKNLGFSVVTVCSHRMEESHKLKHFLNISEVFHSKTEVSVPEVTMTFDGETSLLVGGNSGFC